MSESADELQQMISQLHKESQKIGLKMNMKKTKVMFNNYIPNHVIKVDDVMIERVQEYIYLGQKISANPNLENEIKRRIGMGWSAFGKQSSVMKSNLPIALKRKVYNQCILPVITYGSETWSLTKELERKLQSAPSRRIKLALNPKKIDTKGFSMDSGTIRHAK